jgi:hypothetical protein
VVAYGLSDHYQEIFEITRLSDFIAIFSDERAALASTPAAAYRTRNEWEGWWPRR